MLQAKSKISPVKPILTIPKLELNGALLLSKLTVKVLKALKLKDVDVFLFTDSTDVLFWLSDHPAKWPMYIGNRCSQIHTLLPNANWKHNCTDENPADCASREVSVRQLLDLDLWWKGPRFIRINDLQTKVNFNSHIENFQDSLQQIQCFNLNCSKEKLPKIWDLLDRYSNIHPLFRITSYTFY